MDVANYLIALASREPESAKYLDAITVQKLLFYAQCWSLAEGSRLFDEDVQAWKDGPVVPSVWKAYSGRSKIIPDREPDYELTGDQMDLIQGVWEYYKEHGGFDLRDRTHRAGGAWRQVRGSLPDSARSDKTISCERMAREAEQERSGTTDWLLQNWDLVVQTADQQ